MNKQETLKFVIENFYDYIHLKAYGLLNWHELIENKCNLLKELNDLDINLIVTEILLIYSKEHWDTELLTIVQKLEGL